MSRVLITDGEQRAALALVRSLGRAGHQPFVCSARRRSLAGASRLARGEAVVEDPLDEPAGFVASVQRLAERWKVEVILPVGEAALLALLAERHRFPSVCIPFPDLETFRRVSDKELLLRTAPSLGIAVPEQRVVPSSRDLSALEGLERFPVVLKPSRSVGGGADGRVKLGVRHAADAAELRRAVAELPPEAFPLLVQQRVVGPGVGIFLLLWEGEQVAVFAHRRLREKPPSGGVSVYRESIAADPELARRSRALLESFGWRGVAMVEFKLDARTGQPYLMEVNGRFWGSLQLAVDAGVDFPALLLRAACGHRVEPVTDYRTGIRSRWWWGDVDQLISRLRRSRADLSLPDDAPGRWSAIAEFLRIWRPGDRNEIFRLGDPWPLVRESVDWLHGR